MGLGFLGQGFWATHVRPQQMLVCLTADFSKFVAACPSLAEDYLYLEEQSVETCGPSSEAFAPNGFCADFSPESPAAGREPSYKKLN